MEMTKPRPITITVEADSSADIKDVVPFVHNALSQEDDGSMIIRSVVVQDRETGKETKATFPHGAE